MTSLVILGLIAVLAIWAVGIYNGLVVARNGYKNAFAQIDVQLTRRHDLIPNLVETAKGYMKHERETLEAVITARNAAVTAQKAAAGNPGDPAAMGQLSGAENMLTQTMGRLFALAEAYPDLKANQNFQQLQSELSDIENKIAASRRFLNNAVAEYNATREGFPGFLVAQRFGFDPIDYFNLDPAEQKAIEQAPKVQF